MLDMLLGLLDLFTLERVLFVLVTVGALFPLLGGGVGVVIGAFVDLVKALWQLFSRWLGNGDPMPDGWGGALAAILNVAAFFVIAWISGQNPAEYVLPDNVTQLLLTIASIVSGAAVLIGQLGGSLLGHAVVKKYVPRIASTTQYLMYRNAKRTRAA
jgi:hypothetical protein